MSRNPQAVSSDPSRESAGLSNRRERVDPAVANVLRRILAQRKGLFLGTLGIRLTKDVLPFATPILVGIAVDLLSGKDRSFLFFDLFTNDVKSIFLVAGAMALLAVATTALSYVHTLVSAHLGRHVVETARREIAEASMEMALDERRRFNAGDLLDRSLSDTKGLRTFTQNVVIRSITNTVRAILPLAYMFWADALMALVVLAVIPMQSGFSALLQRRLQRQTRTARALEAEHTSVVKEAIDGWNSVASVGGQSWMTTELHETAAASEDAKIAKKHTTARIAAVINMCTALGIAACYGIGGWRIINSGGLERSDLEGAFTIGMLVAFVGIANKVYAPFRAYTKIVSSYRTGLVNLERIAEVLHTPSIDARPNGPELHVTNGTINLQDVTFRYAGDEEPTLDRLSGSIPGRALTVITGQSGTGKTTLLRLLMGHDVPTSGTVSIDGQDLNQAQLASVRKTMALVPQEPALFTGTLGENLMLGLTGVTTHDLAEACRKAGLQEMVAELPRGLDTDVGSGHQALSGGQLRRLAIARALLRKPAILLLDEPTSGLDQLHSEQVLETLRRISADTTVIMVSHRSEPLAQSDHHLALSNGGWSRGVAGLDARLDPTANHQKIAAPLISATSPIAAGNSTINQHSPNQQSATGLASNLLGLSAAGRPITATYLKRANAVSRILVLNHHRSSTLHAEGVITRTIASLIDAPDVDVTLCAIENVNPDGGWTVDQRTILGVDPSQDHHHRRAVETLVLQRAIAEWKPDLVIDLGRERHERLDSTRPDVEIAIRFPRERTTASATWLNQLTQDVERSMKASSFSYVINTDTAAATSVSAAFNVPTIELLGVESPHAELDGWAIDALTEASVAICHAAVLIDLANTNAAPTGAAFQNA